MIESGKISLKAQITLQAICMPVVITDQHKLLHTGDTAETIIVQVGKIFIRIGNASVYFHRRNVIQILRVKKLLSDWHSRSMSNKPHANLFSLPPIVHRCIVCIWPLYCMFDKIRLNDKWGNSLFLGLWVYISNLT